jgi:outer membrane receptor protein involved in Fe transport
MLQKSLRVLGLLLLTSGFAFSQGSIAGTVTDGITGEAIIGANVVIQGTQIGAPTDIEGKFLIKNVAAGTYSLQVTFITYKPHLLNDVIVENGKRVNIDVKLSEEVSELEEVVVSGVRTIDNDFSLLTAIRESKLVVTGVSAEMISRSPDRDAAEVVKRVPGVTIMGGRFVVIRGLSERYNVSMLHGAYAPSMEADRRSFAFDIIPSGQIDQLLVFKSPSPELPGDFAGGVVKITTKSIPDANTLSVSYSTGFRNGTSFNDFYQGERSGSQFLGFNPGTSDLPANFPTTDQLKGYDLNDPRRARAGRSLPNTWVPETTNAFLDQSVSITGGLKFDIGKIRVGNITSVNLSHSRTRFDVKRQDFNQYDFVANEPSAIYNYTDDQNNLTVRTGILFNWAFRLSDNHTIEFKNLFNQINNSQSIFREGQNFEGNYYGSFGGFSETFRGVYSGQLLGKHKLFDSKTNLNWTFNTGISYRDIPDMRRYRRDVDTQNGNERTYVPVGTAQTYFLGRFYAGMEEISYSGSVGVDHTIEISDNFLPVISAGLFYEAKDRNFDARNLGYVRGSNWDSSNEYLPIDELFEPQNINGVEGLQFDEQTNQSDSYDAQNNLLAYYASVSLPVIKNLNISGGVRIENNTQSLQSAETNGSPLDQDVSVTRILPSANVSYNFTETMLVRATYGQTLNRPEFREIAPFGFYDFEYNWVISGNPGLKTAKINNYDIRWELYPSKTEMITFGAFYKDFENAIEMQFKPGGGSGGIKNFSFENAQSARNYGIELDVRKSLNNLTASRIINRMSVLFNAAFIKSEVNLNNQPRRQLMGQSPYVINTGLYYNDDESGFQVSLLYNVVGKRLFAVGGYTDAGEVAYEDIYEMPRNVLDFSVSKTFREKFQVKFSVSDILNQEYVLLQDGDSNGEFSKTKDQVIQSNRYGSLFTLGLSYKVW